VNSEETVKCAQCRPGYITNEDKTDCIRIPSSNKSKGLKLMIILLIISEFILTVIYILFSKGSTNGLFLMISFAQNLVFLQLLDSGFPIDTINFLNEISGILRLQPFGVFSTPYPSCNVFERKLDTCLTTNLMGYPSRSSFSNLFYQLLYILFLLCFNGIVYALYLRSKKEKELVRTFQSTPNLLFV